MLTMRSQQLSTESCDTQGTFRLRAQAGAPPVVSLQRTRGRCIRILRSWQGGKHLAAKVGKICMFYPVRGADQTRAGRREGFRRILCLQARRGTGEPQPMVYVLGPAVKSTPAADNWARPRPTETT